MFHLDPQLSLLAESCFYVLLDFRHFLGIFGHGQSSIISEFAVNFMRTYSSCKAASAVISAVLAGMLLALPACKAGKSATIVTGNAPVASESPFRPGIS